MFSSTADLQLSTTERASRLDFVIEILLAAVLLFAPFAMGVVDAWSELVVIALVGAMALVLSLKYLLHPDARPVWTAAYVPMGFFVALAVLQLVWLPSTVVHALSPRTVSWKTELLGKQEWMTLSFYPAASQHDLRLILMACVVFVVVLNVYRTEGQIKRLLWTIAIVGGAVSLLALAQDFTHSRAIYWTFPINNPAYSGPFVSHTHFGQFMNLSIGGGIALLLILIRERRKSAIILIVMILGGLASLCLSFTRGGISSMLIAGAVTGMIVLSKVGKRGWIAGIVLLVIALAAIYPIRQRVGHNVTTAQEELTQGRFQVVRDIGEMSKRFPIVGTGLGTHETVFPAFDHSMDDNLSSHAENEFAQVTEEMGYAGLVCVVMFGAILVICFARAVRRSDGLNSAAIGLGFGLLAVAIHSFSDYGQHLPANFVLAAILGALLIRIVRPEVAKVASVMRARPPLSRIMVFIAIAGVWLWALLATDTRRLAEAKWDEVLTRENRLRGRDWLESDEEYADLISEATRLTELGRDNVAYRYWLGVYRWRSLKQKYGVTEQVSSWTGESTSKASEILGDLRQSLALCPTYGPTWTFMGQIEFFFLHDSAGEKDIRTGYELAISDQHAAWMMGRMAYVKKDYPAAVEAFRRAVRITSGSGNVFQSLWEMFIQRIERPDLLAEICRDDWKMSFLVGRNLWEPRFRVYRKQVLGRAIEMMLPEADRADIANARDTYIHIATLSSLAQAYAANDQHEEAVKFFRRAIAMPPEFAWWRENRISWRFELVKSLMALGRREEAIVELREMLIDSPDNADFKKMIERLESGKPV